MQNENYREFVEEQKQAKIPIVLTAADAMDILGVGKNTMYRLLNTGALPAVRIGRTWRISNTSIELFLTESSKEDKR